MTDKTCLRCDWEGRTTGPECPNCRVRPLYIVGASSSDDAKIPMNADPEERGRKAVTFPGNALSDTPPRSDRPISTTASGEASGPSARSVIAFVLAALVVIVILGTWLEATPVRNGSPTSAAPPSSTPANAGPIEGPPLRTHAPIVDGVRLSFLAPTSWEHHDRFSMNRSVVGPQGAEAVIFWTSFPDGGMAHPCARVLTSSVDLTDAELAAAVARAPGTELVSGPSDVTVGGHPAKLVVLTVRENVGCDPGFFYAWNETNGGALWGAHTVADTIRVWIVDVAGTRLFIEAETTDQATPELEDEIQQIVGSTRFEPARATMDLTARIVERFMRARNVYDAERALSLLDPDGATAQLMFDNRTASNMPTVRLDHDELALALEAERLYGVRYGPLRCRAGPDPVGQDVVCSCLMDNRLRQIQGLPRVETSFGIRIRDGRIDSLSFPWLNVSFGPGGVHPAEFRGFVHWLEIEHPDAAGPSPDGTLFRTAGQELILNLTEESLGLLKRYLTEYGRSLDV
jgi:hypothetical protein